MNYPLISEYKEAIRSAEDNFNELSNLRPVLDEDGEPVMTSGNFAVVFKMKDEQTGKLHAVKCFLKEQEGRAEAYRMIAEELEYVNSTFLTPIKYFDKELFVDSKNSDETEFPVLLMDWVEGMTLDKYIREHIDNQYELSLLAYQFSRLAMWLMPQPFAHGDLKPDNILVKDDGTLVLVDYDGMYVPAMKGQKARELGSPDFRHPTRTENDFDEHIDDFSLASILLSLKAISLQPSLLEEYGASDRLLLSEKDYRNLSESKTLDALKHLMQDIELASLYSLYILALSQNNLSQVSFHLFNLNRPDKSQYEEENLSTEVTEEDLANAWIDEFGVKYSKDRKRFLGRSNTWLKEYSIREGTVTICDESMHVAETIIIPKTVQYIGDSPLGGDAAKVICNSDHFIVEDELLLTRDKTRLLACLSHDRVIVTVPKETVTIDNLAFFSNMHANSDNLIEIIRIQNEKVNPFYFECLIMVPNIAVQKGLFKDYDGYAESIIVGEDVYIDEYGAIYSADKKILLCYPKQLPHKEYHIIGGCEELGNMCFSCYVDSDDDGTVSIRCNCIERLFLPSTLNIVGVGVLEGCSALQTIIVEKGKREKMVQLFPNYWNIIIEELDDGDLSAEVTDNDLEHAWTDEYGVKYSADGKKLLGISEDFEDYNVYSIKAGTIVICDKAFIECFNLSCITMPKSIRIIGTSAFYGSHLEELDLPDKVETIGDYAFYNCQLQSIKIPNQLKKMGWSVFKGCRHLSSIIIPEGVTNIGHYAFSNCCALTTITIPNGVVNIGAGAFSDCYKLTSIEIPNSVNEIGDSVFKNCVSLISVILPNGVRSISIETFKGCKQLRTIYLPDRLKTICHGAFEDCTSLTEINIPKGTETISFGTFRGCVNLQSVSLPDSIETIDSCAFFKCKALSSINIPKGIIAIGDRAFCECTSLKVVQLGHVDKIGDCAFYGCSSLTDVEIPDSVYSIGRMAFEGSALISIEIPNSVTSIDDYSFSGCDSLTSIEIPVSVTHIGKKAFSGHSLKSLVVKEGNPQYDSRDNCNGVINSSTNTLILGCEETIIPQSITAIGDSSFSGSKIITLNIPANVKSIGKWAFYDCCKLHSVFIQNGVERIEENAFYGCENLTSITIPNSVTFIGRESFLGTKLSSIYIPKGTKGKFEKMVIVYYPHTFIEV